MLKIGQYCIDHFTTTVFKTEYKDKKNLKEKIENKDNWWDALNFFLHHALMRGRKDELSDKYYDFTVHVLSELKIKGHLEELVLKNIKDDKFFNQLKEELLKSRQIKGYEKPLKLDNKRDIEMIKGVSQFIINHNEKNIVTYSVSQIKDNKIDSIYKELDSIYEIGDKIASFFLRNIVFICLNEERDNIESKDVNIVAHFLPIDTWIRKVALLSGIIGNYKLSEDKIKINMIEKCKTAEVSPLFFNQGAWYIGFNSFELLFRKPKIYQN